MSEQARRPESVAGALGVGAVVVITLMTALAVLGRRVEALEPEETFAGWFQPSELPFGLVPVEAARQANGEVLLHLSNPDAPAEAEKAEPSPEESPSDGKRTGHEEFDWGAIAIGPQDTPPTEAMFVTWPVQAARGQLESLFSSRSSDGPRSLRERSRGVDPLEGLGSEGGRRVLASGRLPWGEFEAPFVHERKFEAGGTFVDTLRVNLSHEQEALVLFLRWPRGLPASQARAEELLAALDRVEPAAAD